MTQESQCLHTSTAGSRGLVIVTTEAFRERRAAEEIESLLLVRGVECRTRTFDKAPGVVLITSEREPSLELARKMLSIAHIRRLIKSLVPLLRWIYSEFRGFEDVAVTVIEEFLPFLWRREYRNVRIAVRCRFRGIRGESRVERIVGYYICRRLCDSCSIDLKRPDILVLIEQVRDLCGAYVGPVDRSVLLYRPYVT